MKVQVNEESKNKSSSKKRSGLYSKLACKVICTKNQRLKECPNK